MESLRDDAIRLSFNAARSVTDDGELTFSDLEEAKVFDILERFGEFREGGGRVGLLSFKSSGLEIGKLDFTKRRKGKVTISSSQSLQIFGREEGTGAEFLLATYVPVAQAHPSQHVVSLNERQSLRLEVNPRRGGSVQLRIICVESFSGRERRDFITRLRSFEWFRPELIPVGVAVLLVIILAPMLINREKKLSESAEHIARNDVGNDKLGSISKEGLDLKPSPQPAVEPDQNANQASGGVSMPGHKHPAVSPPSVNRVKGGSRQTGSTSPSRVGAQSPEPSVSVLGEGGLRSGAASAGGYTSLRDVHTVYVDEQEGGFRQAVRSEIVKRVGELGFVTDVGRDDADARLRMTWESNNRVRFQIISGSHELLNFVGTSSATNAGAADGLSHQLLEQVKKMLK
jgi:hypothetical protein